MNQKKLENLAKAKLDISPCVKGEIRRVEKMLPFLLSCLTKLSQEDYGDGYATRSAYPLAGFGKYAPDLCLIIEYCEVENEPCLKIYIDVAQISPPEEITFTY